MPVFDILSILDRVEHTREFRRVFNDHKDVNISDHDK